MKTNWKAIGIGVAAAAVLAYPALKLYQYLTKRMAGNKDDENEHHIIKTFSPAYRGKRHPHHRHNHNGADLS